MGGGRLEMGGGVRFVSVRMRHTVRFAPARFGFNASYGPVRVGSDACIASRQSAPF